MSKKKSCVHVQQTTFLLLVSSQLEQRLVNESVFIADRSFEKMLKKIENQ